MKILALHIICLLWVTASLQFHLDGQFRLSVPNIKGLTVLTNNSIGIQSANTITILNGVKYDNKMAEIQSDASNTQILVTPDAGVYFGDGSKIIQKLLRNKTNATFNGSGNLIVTDNYLLLGQSNKVPSLKKIDLQTLTLQEKQLTNSTGYKFSEVLLSDPKNGQIVVGCNQTLFFLNSSTLQIGYTLDVPDKDILISEISSSSAADQSTILVKGYLLSGKYRYETYRFNTTTNKYQYAQSFYYNSQKSITLKSPNTAASVYQDQPYSFLQEPQQLILQWENFDKQIILQSQNQDLQLLYGVSYYTVAVNNAENLFVISSKNSFPNLYFINIQDGYQLRINFTVYCQWNFGNIVEGKFTSDDAYFVYLQQTTSTSYELKRLNINTQQQQKLIDGSNIANIQAFLILDKYIITLNVRNKNGTKVILQLINIDNLSVISEFSLKFDATVYKYKLLGNQYWNSSFILSTLSSNDIDAKGTLFRINKNKFQQTNFSISTLDSQKTFASRQYLVNCYSKNQIVLVYYAQNISLYSRSYNFNYELVVLNKQLLIAEKYSDFTYVIDFSQDIENWGRGYYFREYFTDTDNYFRVILPNRGIDLFYKTNPSYSSPTTKVVYDLNNLPISTVYKLNAFFQDIKVIQSSVDEQCQIIFYADDKQIASDNECGFFDLIKVVPYPFPAYNPQLFISSNKEYLLVNFYNDSSLTNSFVQVRLTEDIQTLIQTFSYHSTKPLVPVLKIDISADDRLVVLQLINRIMIFDFEAQQSIYNYNLNSIELFDISNKFIAFFGKADTSQGLIVKQFLSSEVLFAVQLTLNVILLKLSLSGNLVAIYDSDASVTVWDVTTQNLIFKQTFPGLVSVKFINDTSLLLQTSQDITVLTLSSKFLKNPSSRLTASYIKTVVSNDGTLIAAIINQTTISIFDPKQNLIANYSAPQDVTIVDISFSAQNQLFAATSNNTLLVFTPAPCPATFLKINEECLCRNNQSNISNACACKSNFVLQEGQCLCDNEGLFYSNTQCIKCSFLCKECNGVGSSDCTSYSLAFYLGIAGIIVILTAVVVIVYAVKKKRQQISQIGTNITASKAEVSKADNSLTEQLYKPTNN